MFVNKDKNFLLGVKKQTLIELGYLKIHEKVLNMPLIFRKWQ